MPVPAAAGIAQPVVPAMESRVELVREARGCVSV
jgi:hypothetical protein